VPAIAGEAVAADTIKSAAAVINFFIIFLFGLRTILLVLYPI
jgi:hypothetical protein